MTSQLALREDTSFFRSDTLRELREARGLTVRELAEQLGLSASYLSGIECGQFLPSLQRLLQIRDYFENDLSAYFLN
jgi:transcriptional regulator with XRE-family HTH domain